MAAAGTATGLSGADVDQIRAALSSGRRPKVVFTAAAGQIAGQTGQVVELGDPAGADEWILVRFGSDELPFSPADVALPTRGAPRRPAAEPEFRLGDAPRKGPRANGRPAPRQPAPAGSPTAVRPPTVAARAPGPATVAAKAGDAKAAGAAPPATAEPAEPRPGRPAKVRPPASLTVTLTYADREWMVAATQGSRTLAKPHVIRPADALRMVALIDVAGVHDAVEGIIAAERADAETRARRLREELAEIEARLSELG
jgi:hypothetical protein